GVGEAAIASPPLPALDVHGLQDLSLTTLQNSVSRPNLRATGPHFVSTPIRRKSYRSGHGSTAQALIFLLMAYFSHTAGRFNAKNPGDTYEAVWYDLLLRIRVIRLGTCSER